MFILWFENLMEISGIKNLNFETNEVQRTYWDKYNERR